MSQRVSSALLVDKAFSLLARLLPWVGSSRFWQWRYRLGGSSGAGSYGEEARSKADFLNAFFKMHSVRSVVEFGCGDGSQIALLEVEKYLGLDISLAAIERCRSAFQGDDSKRFCGVDEAPAEYFDAALSLDVIYHLVEDDVYFDYLERLFGVAAKWVVIYSSNPAVLTRVSPHVLHRPVVSDVESLRLAYSLVEATAPSKSPLAASFIVFRRID